MSIRNLLFSVFAVLVLAGCSSDIFLVHNGNMPSPDKAAQISKGQTRAQVAEILGSPSSVASFGDDTWIYMSSTLKEVAFCEPEEIDREILAVTFNDKGTVSRISRYSLEDGRGLEADTDYTPTAGHKIGFFRKYFGGVGAYMPIAPGGSADGL